MFNRLKIYSLNRKTHTEDCKASNVRLLATSIRIVWTKPREMGREKDSGEEGLGKEWILWRPAGGGERGRVRGGGLLHLEVIWNKRGRKIADRKDRKPGRPLVIRVEGTH